MPLVAASRACMTIDTASCPVPLEAKRARNEQSAASALARLVRLLARQTAREVVGNGLGMGPDVPVRMSKRSGKREIKT
jgi:hypothetical protein